MRRMNDALSLDCYTCFVDDICSTIPLLLVLSFGQTFFVCTHGPVTCTNNVATCEVQVCLFTVVGVDVENSGEDAGSHWNLDVDRALCTIRDTIDVID